MGLWNVLNILFPSLLYSTSAIVFVCLFVYDWALPSNNTQFCTERWKAKRGCPSLHCSLNSKHAIYWFIYWFRKIFLQEAVGHLLVLLALSLQQWWARGRSEWHHSVLICARDRVNTAATSGNYCSRFHQKYHLLTYIYSEMKQIWVLFRVLMVVAYKQSSY